MATKTEFLAEIDAQVGSIREALDQAGSTITANAATIGDLQSRRKQAVREWSRRLLPDLRTGALDDLARKLPGFITAEQVAAMLESAARTYQTQLQRLLADFDPSKFKDEKLKLDVKLAETESDFAPIRELHDELAAIPDLKRLVAGGYGTDAYRCHWWQRQYYRDWKAADRAVAQARVKDWKDLLEQWETRSRDMQMMTGVVAGLKEQAADLEAKRSSHQDLLKTIENVPETVRDQIGVKLEARLESADPVPEWMSGVATLNRQLAELQESNLNLQTARSKMSEQLANLQNIRIRAASSRKRDVPDAYVDSFRSRRSSGGFSGATVVNVYDDNLLVDLLLLEQMNSYFTQDARPAYDGGYAPSPQYASDPVSSPSAVDLTTQS